MPSSERMKFSRHCFWRWTTSVPVGALPELSKSHLYLPVKAHCSGFALGGGPSPCRGRTAQRATHLYYLPVDGTLPCPGFALWRSGPSPCRGRTARRAVSVLPMRAHCPGLLLAVDRVRASGRTARRATCICRCGRTALAASCT